MFHIQDGLFFARVVDGRVHIVLRENKEDGEVIFETEISADGWASIVASVSWHGEDAKSWEAARAFHNAP